MIFKFKKLYGSNNLSIKSQRGINCDLNKELYSINYLYGRLVLHFLN